MIYYGTIGDQFDEHAFEVFRKEEGNLYRLEGDTWRPARFEPHEMVTEKFKNLFGAIKIETKSKEEIRRWALHKALLQLREMKTEYAASHIEKSPYYEKGDEEAPFFSEAYLYNLLGKNDARTVLHYISKLERLVSF